MENDLVTVLKRSIKLGLYYVSRVPMVYRVCKRIVDLHNGEQEIDFAINGERRFLQEMLREARVAFDVGANIGDWTALALQLNPTVQIHCFEPSPTTFRLLQSRQLPSRVLLNNFGLGDVAGEAILHIIGEGHESGCNSLYVRTSLPQYREMKAVAIEIDTFDRYCQRAGLTQVDLVKIDTEGHELSVLKGMRESLRQGQVRAIQFEYGGTYIDACILLRNVWDFVKEVNPHYQFHKLGPTGARRILHYTPALENFQYANYAIILTD